MTDKEVALHKLTDQLQADLRTLCSESKRRHPAVKEAGDSAILKLRQVAAGSDMRRALINWNNELVHPLVLACNTKQNKIVIIALGSLHRLITAKLVTEESAAAVVHTLWSLMEAGIEEVKLLQTAILLVTSSRNAVRDRPLAKALVMAFRLHFHRSPTTTATAAAAIRQCVHAVFDRVSAEADELCVSRTDESTGDNVSTPPPLGPAGRDALMLFADLCHMVNGEQPHWLQGLTEMTRTLGLDLLESCLSGYPQLFRDYPDFTALLKGRVCPLVIKLFSPSIKHKLGSGSEDVPSTMAATTGQEKANFAIAVRLMRLVQIVVEIYFDLLRTECEIFLSLVVRFLEVERPTWQRPLALETLQRIMSQTRLVSAICTSYDLKPHSTKIFRDMVTGVSSFVQNTFVNLPASGGGLVSVGGSQQGSKDGGVPPALIGGLPVGAGVTPSACFIYRGNCLPIHMNPRAIFQDMLDRIDPGPPPDGYTVSVAFHALLEVIKSVSSIIGLSKNAASQAAAPEDVSQDEEVAAGPFTAAGEETASPSDEDLRNELLSAVWCGALAALSLLLDASTDESATEAVLKAEETMVALCGGQDLTTPRDAFVTALCKASLPTNYALAVLASAGSGGSQKSVGASPRPGGGWEHESGGLERSQVVAVGTALPTSGSAAGVSLGPVMLTAKNIQCMRAILSVAHCHGSVLGNAWHLVLNTLQHLVWILGLKPAAATGGLRRSSAVTAAAVAASGGSGSTGGSGGGSGGSSSADLSGGSTSSSAVITTAVIADLPVLCNMLSRLFESSQYLDEVALHHLIDALCKLSTEAMEVANSSREPSLFAVAKLLETGLVNMHRIEVLWKPVTAHLLEVAQQTHAPLRQMAADALVALVREATNHKFEPPLWKNEKLSALVLHPLSEMSTVLHNDVRGRQLDCVQHILHYSGDRLGASWRRVIQIIGDVNEIHVEALVRQAFQCLQLVITDFLSTISPTCYTACVQVVLLPMDFVSWPRWESHSIPHGIKSSWRPT